MSPAPAKAMTFRCRACHVLALVAEMQLDAEGSEICGDCYLKAPPAVDVDGVFAEVAASYAQKPEKVVSREFRGTFAELSAELSPTTPSKIDSFPVVSPEFRGTFAELSGKLSPDPETAKAELLRQLGAALGCAAKGASESAGACDLKATDKVDGFPARCWFNGPFEAAPRAPKVQLEALTQMDREARELAARGQRDIVRFAQMMARARRPK